MCLDVDECETNDNRCDPENQNCVNKKGGYYCVCKHGFIWNNTENACSKKY